MKYKLKNIVVPFILLVLILKPFFYIYFEVVRELLESDFGLFFHRESNIVKSFYSCHNSTKLLIAVLSNVNDMGERMFLRRTWGKNKRNVTELKFIVGNLPYINNTIFMDLAKEQQQFKDIVMTKVLEHHKSNTVKTLSLLHSHTAYCKSVTCILKVNSDTVINIPQFEKLCDENQLNEAIYGYCLPKEIRQFLKKPLFHNYLFKRVEYPVYCQGESFLIVGNATPKKIINGLKEFGYFESLNKQNMPEELLFTGFAAELSKVKRVHDDRFIPCISGVLDCLRHYPLPKNWISATIGKENMPFFYKCSTMTNWKNCVITDNNNN